MVIWWDSPAAPKEKIGTERADNACLIGRE